MLEDAKRARVQIIFLSDHFRPPRDFMDSWRGLHEGVLFVPGSETHGFLVHPEASMSLAEVAVLQENWDEAERCLDEAWDHCTKSSSQMATFCVLDDYARLALARGDHSKAKRYLRDASENAIQQGRVIVQIAMLATAAAYWAQVGEDLRASELSLAVHGHPACPHWVKRGVQPFLSKGRKGSVRPPRRAPRADSVYFEGLCRAVSRRLRSRKPKCS